MPSLKIHSRCSLNAYSVSDECERMLLVVWGHKSCHLEQFRSNESHLISPGVSLFLPSFLHLSMPAMSLDLSLGLGIQL